MSTRSDWRTQTTTTTRSRDNVATTPRDPNVTRSGGVQIPGQRGTSAPGAHRMDRQGNVYPDRNTQYQGGDEVIQRIRNHVTEILGRGGYMQEDYQIRFNNIMEARHYARGNEAEQLYANVAILEDSGPLQAGFDLAALQQHWPIIAAVGGGLLLLKLLKGKK